jgi:hypothetical protein
MIYEQPLFFFDAMAVIMMLVLAYLSKRLGEAMHIRPYYLIHTTVRRGDSGVLSCA